MVLKILLIFTVCISQLAHADLMYEVKKLVKKEEYTKARDLILANRDIDNHDAMIEIVMLGKVYDSLEDFENAIKVYETLINKHFKKLDSIIQRDYRLSGLEELSETISSKLTRLYFYLGKSLYHLTKVSYIENKKDNFRVYKKQAKRYLELASEGEGEDSSKAEKYLKKLSVLIAKFERQSLENKWGFDISAVYWSDDIRVKGANNSSKETQTASSVLRFGLEYRLYRDDSFIRFKGGYFTGTTNIGNSNEVGFFQSNVPVAGLDYTTSIHFISPFKDASIGIGLVTLYRTIVFTPPSGIEISEISQFTYGLEVQNLWHFKNSYIHLDYGMLAHFKSLYTSFGYGYLF